MSQLRALGQHCNYGSSLDDMLRDCLVCGIADTRIQQQLLAKKNLTYKSALEIAQSMETAAKSMQTLQGAAAASSEPAVYKVSHSKKTNQPTSGNTKSNTQCYRCGQSGHVAQRCRFRTAKCHHCGKTGHIKAACRSAQQKTQRSQHHPVLHCNCGDGLPGLGPGYMQTLLVHFWAVCFWLWWMPTPSG